MTPARWALALYAVYLLVAFGLRTFLQLRRTGATGWKGLGGRPGSLEWCAGVLFAVALAGGVAAPLLAELGLLEPLPALDRREVRVAGFALFAAGLLGTFGAQVRMGASWRIGVDPAERTALVTSGPFAVVRNPIFSAMIPASVGLVLIAPNVVAVVSAVALVIALELQVRFVEEPYLLRTHGAAYRVYAARVGRFIPFVGRIH